LTEDQVEFAWENFIRKEHRATPNNDQIRAVGTDRNGRLIEIVGVIKPYGTLIYHALTPPTMKMLIELGMVRR
jgi:hypothetical protein